MTRPDVTGDDVVRKIAERVVELRKGLEDIAAEIARSSAAHRKQAERLGQDMDAIHAEVSQRAQHVIESRPETSRRDQRDDHRAPAANPGARAPAKAP
jgi:hypothetical protein